MVFCHLNVLRCSSDTHLLTSFFVIIWKRGTSFSTWLLALCLSFSFYKVAVLQCVCDLIVLCIWLTPAQPGPLQTAVSGCYCRTKNLIKFPTEVNISNCPVTPFLLGGVMCNGFFESSDACHLQTKWKHEIMEGAGSCSEVSNCALL